MTTNRQTAKNAAFTFIVVGKVGEDPTIRTTKNGSKVLNFSLAVNVEGNLGYYTQWFRIACWEELAEQAAQVCKKGATVRVTAKAIKPDHFNGKDGKLHLTLEVTAAKVEQA